MCFPILAALPAALGLGGGATAAGAAATGAGAAAAGAASAVSAASVFQTLGAGLSALGTAASAMQAADGYRAQQAFSKRQARLERQQGDFETRRLRERGARLMGKSRAGLLSGGVALEGSAVDALRDMASELSLDEQAARFGTEIRAGNALYQAGLAGANARSARIGGAIGALSPIVGRLSVRPRSRITGFGGGNG